MDERTVLIDFYDSTYGQQWIRNWNLQQPITSWFGVVTNDNGSVTGLTLPGNNLGGFIPTTLGLLTSLTTITFSNNTIGGSVPVSICNLKMLQIINLDSNAITGLFPSCLGKNSQLQSLLLNNNQMSGAIPPTIGNCTNLIALSLERNNFTGELPLSVGNLSKLRYFTIGYNRLSKGRLPNSMCNLKYLQSVGIYRTLCYPTCLGRAVTVGSAAVYSLTTRCQGPEDFALCSLVSSTNIKSQLVQQTVIYSSTVESIHPFVIPISNLTTDITVLNAISYEITFDSFSDVSPTVLKFCNTFNCTDVIYRDLSKVPLSQLPGYRKNPPLNIRVESAGSSLYVKLSASINCVQYLTTGLSCWGYRAYLTAVVDVMGWNCSTPVSQYALYSSTDTIWDNAPITYETSYANKYCNWYGVGCQSNQLVTINLGASIIVTGRLNEWFGKFAPSSLNTLDFSANILSGDIPSSIGLMTSLTTLNLASNAFNGSLPISMRNLTKLRELRVDINSFSGPFPTELLFAMNNSCKTVDLSSNKFTGQVPAILSQLSSQCSVLLRNNLFDCYDSDLMLSGNIVLGVGLHPCAPTQTPTSLPTVPQDQNQPFQLIASGIAGIAVGACCFACISYASVYYYLFLSKKAKRRKRLKMLPVHRAIRKRMGFDRIVELINSHESTLLEVDVDGLNAFDTAVLPEFIQPDPQEQKLIIWEIARRTLPFERSSKLPVALERHGYIWTKVIQSDRNEEVVRMICRDNKNIAEQLAFSPDPEGRPAIHIASPSCRTVIERNLFFMERYEILSPLDNPHHRSITCVILMALDHEESNLKVALKFMKNKGQFNTEVDVRSRGNFDPTYVINILRTYDSDLDDKVRSETHSRGFSQYPYCIVMPAADRSLSAIISSESLAGKNWPSIKHFTQNIAEALHHMHQNGYIHGDVKPLNVVRAGNNMKLIDLDTSAQIGIGFSGQKYSSAYVPPELLYKDEVTYKVRTYEFECVNCTEVTPPGSVDGNNKTFRRSIEVTSIKPVSYELLIAAPSHDIWSFGVLLFELFSGVTLFLSNDEDNLDDDELTLLGDFLDDFKRRKLSKIQDVMARNLVSQLLMKDPRKRPPMSSVLAHPFLSGGRPARLPGEAPEFDVFISYRVASDAANAVLLYDMLTSAGVKVWFDKMCLLPGVSWEEGFADGLVKSSIFIPLLTRGAINNPKLPRSDFAQLTADSPCDNVLLEHRLALEFSARGLVQRVYPVMIGDVSKIEPYGLEDGVEIIGNYFADGCHPKLIGDVIVRSVEAQVESHLNRLCLGCALLENMSVSRVLKEITSKQGKIIEGVYPTAFDPIVHEVLDMIKLISHDEDDNSVLKSKFNNKNSTPEDSDIKHKPQRHIAQASQNDAGETKESPVDDSAEKFGLASLDDDLCRA